MLMTLKKHLDLTIPTVEYRLGKRRMRSELTPGKATQVGDAEVSPFEVDHGLKRVGLRMEQRGSAMVHAAGTRPRANVVEYARGADLLVREAYGLGEDNAKAGARLRPPHTAAGRAGSHATLMSSTSEELTSLL
jgi:ribonuclease BN (tRNA processing enzyme)